MAMKKKGVKKVKKAAPAKLTRIVPENRIAAREAEGWTRVAGVAPLRSGAIRMEKSVG